MKDRLERGALVGVAAAVLGLLSEKGFHKRTTTAGTGLANILLSSFVIGAASVGVDYGMDYEKAHSGGGGSGGDNSKTTLH